MGRPQGTPQGGMPISTELRAARRVEPLSATPAKDRHFPTYPAYRTVAGSDGIPSSVHRATGNLCTDLPFEASLSETRRLSSCFIVIATVLVPRVCISVLGPSHEVPTK